MKIKRRPYIKDYSTRILVKRGKKHIGNLFSEMRGQIQHLNGVNADLRRELKKDKDFPFRLGFMLPDAWRGDRTYTFQMQFNELAFRYSPFVREANEYGMVNKTHAAMMMLRHIEDAAKHHILKVVNGEVAPAP